MKIILLTLLALGGYAIYQYLTPPFADSREFFATNRSSVATLHLSSATYSIRFDPGLTVAEALRRSGFLVTEKDSLSPPADSVLLPGSEIIWHPARTIRIQGEGKETLVQVIAPTAEAILEEAGIAIDEDDLVTPGRGTTVANGGRIVITRVEIKEEVKEVSIPFATKTDEDNELSWRKKIVTQKGESGLKRTTYKVSYHNGKEVNRKVLSTEVVKEPVTEVVTQGTYVKTGKSHRGAASWYAWTGTMAAANPWLPKGSYVKVTNLDNGKSVIVVINDRGPFVPGRIIDLDKVAFEKIASIGAGVINVKMEEIVN